MKRTYEGTNVPRRKRPNSVRILFNSLPPEIQIKILTYWLNRVTMAPLNGMKKIEIFSLEKVYLKMLELFDAHQMPQSSHRRITSKIADLLFQFFGLFCLHIQSVSINYREMQDSAIDLILSDPKLSTFIEVVEIEPMRMPAYFPSAHPLLFPCAKTLRISCTNDDPQHKVNKTMNALCLKFNLLHASTSITRIETSVLPDPHYDASFVNSVHTWDSSWWSTKFPKLTFINEWDIRTFTLDYDYCVKRQHSAFRALWYRHLCDYLLGRVTYDKRVFPVDTVEKFKIDCSGSHKEANFMRWLTHNNEQDVMAFLRLKYKK